MTLTNSLGLPEPLVQAIANDDYTPGDCDFTTTQLIRPVRMNSLLKKHGGEISEDASDGIFRLFGKAIHVILDAGTRFGRYITERRFYADFDGTRLSGQIDVFDTETATLCDYKICSRYVVADGIKPEWKQQANINRWLMEQNGIEVYKMNVVAIFRDWSKMMAARKDDYPERQVQILDVPKWTLQKTEEFIRERIKAHKEGMDDPPLCSPEERWSKPTKWALMRQGGKRAVKLFDTEAEAQHVKFEMRDNFPRNKLSVEERPGEETRCLHYCSVWQFCDFGKLVHEK